MTPSRRTALASLAGLGASVALPTAALATTTADHPDGSLLALGADLDRIALEIAPLRDRVNAICEQGLPDDPASFSAFDVLEIAGCDLVERIATVRATTLAGLVVKGRALAFIYRDGIEHFLDKTTTDDRVASSMLSDLLTIGGAA